MPSPIPADRILAAKRLLDARPSWPLRVLRVAQLDADMLDSDLASSFKDQFIAMFVGMPDVKDRFDPEIVALLHLIMMYPLYFSSASASYGLQIQNLKYRNEWMHMGTSELAAVNAPLTRWQKALHALLTIGGRWGWIRFNQHASRRRWSDKDEGDWRYRTWMLLGKIEQAFNVIALANFLMFLYNGRYRSVVDRLLGMRLVYQRREVARQVSFDYMNRQLVWQAFSEFLVFLIPIVNLNRVQSLMGRVFSNTANGAKSLPAHVCPICVRDDRIPSVVQSPTQIYSPIHYLHAFVAAPASKV
ncbi:hypothetical protein HK101_009173 [Irineochytrium annulatum]|nr:hypothetical protein HK101_009173 [Irineochytrium annulatum]